MDIIYGYFNYYTQKFRFTSQLVKFCTVIKYILFDFILKVKSFYAKLFVKKGCKAILDNSIYIFFTLKSCLASEVSVHKFIFTFYLNFDSLLHHFGVSVIAKSWPPISIQLTMVKGCSDQSFIIAKFLLQFQPSETRFRANQLLFMLILIPVL